MDNGGDRTDSQRGHPDTAHHDGASAEGGKGVDGSGKGKEKDIMEEQISAASASQDPTVQEGLVEGLKAEDSLLKRLHTSTGMAISALGSGSLASSASEGKQSGPARVSQRERESSHLRPTPMQDGRLTTDGSTLGPKTSPSSAAAFESFANAAPKITTDVTGWPNDTTSSYPPPSSAVAHQETLDGRDVSTLLSSFEEREDLSEETSNADPWGIPEEAAAALRGSLFQTDTSPPWDNLLSFTPSHLFRTDTDSASVEARRLFGTADVDEARRLWIRQWSEALSAYTDQVWGSLRPLVEEARDELQRFEESRGGTVHAGQGTQSLERLQQILAHVRGAV